MPDVLLATDADSVADDVEAALGGDHEVRRVRRGVDVTAEVAGSPPALVVLDLQIGNMGGMATCMSLHLDAGAGRLERVPILMLLDRAADVFLARRSSADGWLVKPIDAFGLRRAATALLDGGRWPADAAATATPVPDPEPEKPDATADPDAPGDTAGTEPAHAAAGGGLGSRKRRRGRKAG